MKQEVVWNSIDSFEENTQSCKSLVYRNCPVCGFSKFKNLFSLDDFQFYSDSNNLPKRANIATVQCSRCFANFMNPAYSDEGFQILFSEAGKSYGSSDSHQKEQIKWIAERDLINNNTVLLDVGCYDGSFLSKFPEEIYKIGIDIDAVAINKGIIEYSKNNFELYHGSFEEFKSPKKPTIITMHHVLEHLNNPMEVLQNLRKNSDSKTKLIVEIPVIENYIGEDINGFFSIQHQTHFTKLSLANLFTIAGWKIIEIFDLIDYNGYRVLAEITRPNEIFYEKSEIDKNHTDLYLNSYAEQISLINLKIDSMELGNNIIIWGAGAHTEFLYQKSLFFKKNPNAKFILIDSDFEKINKSWRGIKIYSSEILNLNELKEFPIIISSYGSQIEIINFIKEKIKPSYKIFTLYSETFPY
ncbi:MAG: class I SAM-dependent methyltransferase [Crocinitomicaceae bacterium]|nr:class I SAM-dependent methyltransferase [Crocinitomicaceae bacterium]